MERDLALDAILEREPRNCVWGIATVNVAIVVAVTTLGVWLFPG
jgi:hypothetical protein